MDGSLVSCPEFKFKEDFLQFGMKERERERERKRKGGGITLQGILTCGPPTTKLPEG